MNQAVKAMRWMKIGYWGVLLAGATLIACPLTLIGQQPDPPSRDWLGRHLFGGADILAYEIWSGVPHVAYQFRDESIVSDRRVYFDHMRADLISIEWPPVPAWQLTGLGYSIPASNPPATAGLARCTGTMGETCAGPTEIFGQINDPRIVEMRILYQASWHSFAVASPGYAVRLNGFGGTPDAYAWFDSDSKLVWQEP